MALTHLVDASVISRLTEDRADVEGGDAGLGDERGGPLDRVHRGDIVSTAVNTRVVGSAGAAPS